MAIPTNVCVPKNGSMAYFTPCTESAMQNEAMAILTVEEKIFASSISPILIFKTIHKSKRFTMLETEKDSARPITCDSKNIFIKRKLKKIFKTLDAIPAIKGVVLSFIAKNALENKWIRLCAKRLIENIASVFIVRTVSFQSNLPLPRSALTTCARKRIRSAEDGMTKKSICLNVKEKFSINFSLLFEYSESV